ncbi:hypothetical protein Srot_2746 [Segniliparus rotundus DSM 44985]|uniref:Uncharacterized protein n=1 Tax=Segniliparus rotundus (strain ATCC BAA-972 / CDC 1076 / CIP 108378 / DSM 44985 / JCM 13578) TaxID=640132 RepID=D6ZCZ3_SEGRD|nr:hypothetical protein [Segniliparus rotundus]ADG99180.1 hypothetical protein Srot_2746 [Segniliparus rotundus DSM 44985]
MVNQTEASEPKARKRRGWGKAALALCLAGIASLVLYMFAADTAGKEYVKHPCPTPPVPWTVQATWFLAFGLFTAAIIAIVATGFFAWSSQKTLTVLCVFWALVAALPLVFLADVYGQGYLGGPDGPNECVGGRVASP